MSVINLSTLNTVICLRAIMIQIEWWNIKLCQSKYVYSYVEHCKLDFKICTEFKLFYYFFKAISYKIWKKKDFT